MPWAASRVQGDTNIYNWKWAVYYLVGGIYFKLEIPIFYLFFDKIIALDLFIK